GTVVANMKSDWLPGRGYKVLESLDEAEIAAADVNHAVDADPAEQEQPEEELEQEPGEAGEQHAAMKADAEETSEPIRRK
ncbi:MAG: hypothetical protein ACOC71_05415, partial [Hyphomicrobiales bacterium]